MKKAVFFLLFFFIVAQKSVATEWLTYYVYVQKEYLQGPWKRADLLGQDSYAYLHAQQYEELFGSEPVSLANAILKHLREETPERYTFQSTLVATGDTVVIQTRDTITDFEAVRNELVASLLLNNFSTVKIIQPGSAAFYGLQDISVPYMDLVFPSGREVPLMQSPDSLQSDINTSARQSPPAAGKSPGNKLSLWLILSVIINILLVVLLLRKRN